MGPFSVGPSRWAQALPGPRPSSHFDREWISIVFVEAVYAMYFIPL